MTLKMGTIMDAGVASDPFLSSSQNIFDLHAFFDPFQSNLSVSIFPLRTARLDYCAKRSP
ncbi:MAG: hypothetical protein WAT12_10520 [Candidatus Nitrotoga sp.]